MKVIPGHWPGGIGEILSPPSSWELIVSYDIIQIPDPSTPVRYICSQSELLLKIKIHEKNQNTLSMNKRFLPFESEFSGLLEQVEIELNFENFRIQEISR